MRLQAFMALANLALFFAACAPALGGDSHDLEATVRELVKRLGDEEYRVREEATSKLTALGSKAGPALLAFRDHEDPEVRLRVRQVLETLGILTPEQEESLKTLMDRLFVVPAMERNAVAREILLLGRVARRRLEHRLLVPVTQVKVTCLPPSKWFVAGKKARSGWCVRLRNTGKTPLLIPAPVVPGGGGSMSPLTPPRIHSRTIRGGAGFGFTRTTSGRRPFSTSRILPPGGVIEVPAGGATMNQPGRWTVRFNLQVEATATVNGNPLRYGLRDPARPVGSSGKLHAIRAFSTVHAFPDWSAARTCRGGTLGIVPRAENVRVGEVLEADVRLSNGGEKPVCVEAFWDRYAWVALAECDGKSLVFSTVLGLRSPKTPAGEAPTKFEPLDLEPGKEEVRVIALKAPDTPGTYFLACGYDLRANEKKDKGSAVDLVARAATVRVLPREKK
jgi:hypothetical protein